MKTYQSIKERLVAIASKDEMSPEDITFVRGLSKKERKDFKITSKRGIKNLRKKIKKLEYQMTEGRDELDLLERLAEEAKTLPHPVWISRIPKKYWPEFEGVEQEGHRAIIQNHMDNDYPVVTVSQELETIIENCEMNEAIPCEHVKMPMFKGCYFHLPYCKKTKDGELFLGFYMENTTEQGHAGIMVSMVFESEITVVCFIPHSAQEIGEYLKTKPAIEPYMEIIAYIVMLLFYCNSAQYRTELRPEYSELVASVCRKKSEAKKRKLQKRLDRKYDYILINPAVSSGLCHGGTGNTVSPHFRRGHFRLQHYGPRWSMDKLIFIDPCFIHGHAKIKDYMVD